MLNNIVALLGNGGGAANSYESIQTYTVGSGGQASITFSSIPSTYTHLQVRYLSRSSYGTGGGDIMVMNTNLGLGERDHLLLGNGSVAASEAHTNSWIGVSTASGSGYSNMFGVGIIDILDYANTNKNRVARALTGHDNNGSGELFYFSWLKTSTSAITSLTFTNSSGSNFAQYTHFALYGIKGA